MKILAYPRDPNPYQELLYAPMRKQGVTVDYLEGPSSSHTLNILFLPFLLVGKRLAGYGTLHLHWTYPFTLPWAGRIGKRIMQWHLRFFLRTVKMLNFKLVWTVHNVLPHSPQFVNDLQMRRLLCRRADAIIAHSTSTHQQLQALGISVRKAAIIPHGNYDGIYPSKLSHQAARQRLGIPGNAFVAAFVGKIEHYKNIPALLDATQTLSKTYPQLHVVIAGACKDPSIKHQLQRAQHALGNKLIVHDKHIADGDMQVYFNAADIVVCPFSEITTSGSILLSLTFGVPVVAPRTGALQDIPASVGFFYDRNESDGLQRAIATGITKQSLAAQRTAALAYAHSLSWKKIASKTEELFTSV